MSLELIDTHCHLTNFEDSHLALVIERAQQNDVYRFLCVGAGYGLDSAVRALELANNIPSIWASVGIHPHDAGKFPDFQVVAHLAVQDRVVAIGETGLDYFRDWAPRDLQEDLFRQSIRFAKKQQKPLIIHCRDAEEDVLRVLREEDAAAVGGVVHCFSGDLGFAEAVFEENFLISFTGNITFKKATALQDVVQKVPLRQMMLETDTPYMAPEPFRGKPSEPMHVRKVAEKMAEIRSCSLEEVARVTTENAVALFKFPAA